MSKNDGDSVLVAVHDKPCCLVRRITVKDTPHLHLTITGSNHGSLIGHNAYGIAADPRVATQHCFPVFALVRFKITAVYYPCHNFFHVIRTGVLWNNSVEILRWQKRFCRFHSIKLPHF
jgi:hypothetical protein